MTEQTQELVTKIDVQPDISGIVTFENEIDRARIKVMQLGRAINRVNELQPRNRWAPPTNNPAATAAAAGLATGLGAHLVSRTSLAPIVSKAAQETAKKATEIAGNSVGSALDVIGEKMAGGPPALPGGGGGHHGGHSGGGGGSGGRGLFEDLDLPQDVTIGGGRKPVAKAVNKSTGFKMPDMLAGAATAYGLAKSLDAVAESMDRIQSQEQQLERLPQTLGSGKDAYIQLNEAASQVRSDGDAFISTYTNMATATEKLGLSQKETTKATQGLVSSLQLGGGSKEAVSNALYQMGQAFSSDRFGGDEFRSFMEAIGTQAPEVAKAFGTDVKGLRAMSEAGKLTAETMVKAFEKMADKNIELLKKQGWTWGQVTTVMKNNWTTFLAEAGKSGEWSRLMGFIANKVVPTMDDASKSVAQFWSTTTDESKENLLLGILAAIGAGFVALAIPVLAAVWPFLAVGAAVWLLMELFTEFKHWMDGSAKTIFDSLFGSFDEFERRYPNIVKGMKALIDVTKKAADTVNTVREQTDKNEGLKDFSTIPNPGNPLRGLSGVYHFLKGRGNDFNPLNGIEKFLGLFMDGDNNVNSGVMPPPSTSYGASRQTNISNSGNTTIQVSTPEEAATVANQRDVAFITQLGSDNLDNIAEAGGYI